METQARAILKVAAQAASARDKDEMERALWKARYLLDRAIANLKRAADCETHRAANTVAVDAVCEARKWLSHALALEVRS